MKGMRYFLGILGVFLVAIGAIYFVTRPRGVEQPENTGTSREFVFAHEAMREGTTVSFTTQGKLVGQDERRALRITVSKTQRRLELLTGYEEAVARSFTFPNTEAAYETFVIALHRHGFALENQSDAAREDDRGFCPTGKTYIYEFKEFSQTTFRRWDSTCGTGGAETFAGKGSTIQKVFKAQIPDYNQRVRNIL